MAAIVDLDECIGCGNCANICVSEAITMQDGYPVVSDRCVSCGMCVDGCPMSALSVEE